LHAGQCEHFETLDDGRTSRDFANLCALLNPNLFCHFRLHTVCYFMIISTLWLFS